MPHYSASKRLGSFVTRSLVLCGVHKVLLRAALRRASAATLLLLTVILNGAVSARGEVKRISTVYKDLGQSQKIYLHAGLISVLEFPQSILEVRIGNPQSVKAELSKVSSKELTLYLSQSAVEATNLIVKSEKRFYVFDVIPSKTSHQDYIRIAGGFGSPSLESQGRLIEALPLAPKESKAPSGRLIESIKMGGE